MRRRRSRRGTVLENGKSPGRSGDFSEGEKRRRVLIVAK